MCRARTFINIKHVTGILGVEQSKFQFFFFNLSGSQQLLHYKSSSSKAFHDSSIQTKDLSVTEFILLLASSQFWTRKLYLEIHLADGRNKKIKISQDWEK